MPHVQRSRFAARSYELDSYRHLNNGVYVSWFEQARLDWLLALGFSYDGLADRRQWFVVARTEVDFRRPVQLGDDLEIETSIAALGRSSVRFRQVMWRAGEPVCEAATVMVFSGEGGRSIAIPDDFERPSGLSRRPEGGPGEASAAPPHSRHGGFPGRGIGSRAFPNGAFP